MTQEPEPITSDQPGSLAWHVWHERHPALAGRITRAHPYPAAIVAALHGLVEQTLTGIAGDPVAGEPADAVPEWSSWSRQHLGERWLSAPFLWAESYFHYQLLCALGYFTPGPWRGVDPFAFLKTAELDGAGFAGDLAADDRHADLPPGQRLAGLLRGSLWGNQADLGFQIGVEAAGGTAGLREHLVVDDVGAVVERLCSRVGTVSVICDNAGRELLADLLLVDHLLAANLAGRIELHLKPRPYYVSDATTTDLVACLQRLDGAGHAAGARLHDAAVDGRFIIATDPFWCSPLTFREFPGDLGARLAESSVVLVKGDLNYRRLVGDLRWPPTEPFATTVGYFPAPVVALRTLKSDVVVGVDPSRLSTLDSGSDAASWRVSGHYAMVQGRL